MKRAYATLLATSLIALTSAPLMAQDQASGSVTTTTEHKTRVDGNSGTVAQEHKSDTEVHSDRSKTEDGAATKEHSSSKVSKQTGPDGTEHESVESDRSKAEVRAEPNGDVSIEQKKQHTEQQATH